jgi:integrase/recombinase XerD
VSRAQRRASPHTIASHRDTFKLLLGYVHERTGKLPSQLDFAYLDAPLISGFLAHLESRRGNGITTRNAGWRQSTRCSATSRSVRPSMPR